MARKRKPRRGRPPLGAGKRSRTVRIRVTPAFEQRVQAAAEAAEMTVSDWGLGVLVTALSEPTEPIA